MVIDNYFRYGYVYLISQKSQALQCFQKYKAGVEDQFDRKIKTLRFDRGGKYLSEEFNAFSENYGIKRQFTMSDRP